MNILLANVVTLWGQAFARIVDVQGTVSKYVIMLDGE